MESTVTTPTGSEAVETPAPGATPPFSAAEQEAFHAEDRGIAGSITGIMVTIFLVALIAYTFIAFVARAVPWP